MAAVLWLVDTSIGHRLIADAIGRLRPENGLRFSVGRITGSVWRDATLIDFELRDPKGRVLAVPRARLVWNPFAWLANRLDIDALDIPVARLERMPQLAPTARRGPVLPGFDIHVGRLAVRRLVVDARVTGQARSGWIRARADVHDRRALVDVSARVEGSDDLRLKLDIAPDRDRFDANLRANGAKEGLIARMSGLDRPVSAVVVGDGRWSRWRGTAQARVAGAEALDLALAQDAGRYTLGGTVALNRLLSGKAARIGHPVLRVRAAARLENRQLEGDVSLRSQAIAVDTNGGVDLARGAWRDVRVRVRALDPGAIVDRMTGRDVELRAVLDGAFARARIDYRLTAGWMRFGGRETLEDVRAAGASQFSRAPLRLPIRVEVARVTGVDDVSGRILRGLSVNGDLFAISRALRGDAMAFRSDKLSGKLDLFVDLVTGRFQVNIDGALGNFEIPGLGVFDVTSKLTVVPANGQRGALLTGSASAVARRFDDPFFASLTHGLPHLEAQLAQGTDGILHLNRLRLTAPGIAIEGSGLRRPDGTLRLQGRGTQRDYGPFTLALDGRIERPTVDLLFDHPNAALGLRDVALHLDPVAEGFAFAVHGGSRLGAFQGRGTIALPPGGATRIAVTALDTGDMHASGVLTAVPGGFEGALALRGAATGALAFTTIGEVQRIEAHLDVANGTIGDSLTLRRGRLDAAVTLDPKASVVEARASGTGLRQGSLALGRFTARAMLRDGAGHVSAELSGARGRSFDLRAEADVDDNRWSITGEGSLDRRPIKLLAPAIVTRSGDAWRLAPARLSIAGGEGEVSGSYGDGGVAVDTTLVRLPLSVLDIAFPGLGLSGSATGKLRFADMRGAAPNGRVDLTIRGLSRSGLALSSQPIDVGIAAVLDGRGAAARAVMAAGGRTIGRAQARLAPLGEGDLVKRLVRAGLFAQLRYDGPADTLWRLTGIELFDLSGPVAIGADLSGHVNDPSIIGSLSANGARIESTRTGTVLTNVRGVGRFSGSVLRFDTLTADAGKGGSVSASGAFDFAAVHGFGIDLKLLTHRAVMINRDDIGATMSGPLSFHSDGDGGTISGDVTLDASRYRLGQAVAASAVPALDVREINLRGEDDEEATPARPWRLDVRARAGQGLNVTGLGLSSDWSADMRLAGTVEAPTISGRADLVRGTFEFAGRDFAISRGTIRFLGNSPPDPAVDISASADTTGLSATIKVSGPATKPEIAFTSVPALPQDELLSRLLFGTSITNLSAPEALQLASAVAALQSGGGLNPINALRRVAGLDRLRVLPADKTIGRSTSFAAGKYITRRLYAEIITDGQGYSATQVEYRVTRWLSVLSTISTLGRQSANVRVSKDY